ncbi:MAG TPA: BTAD domain-containing putative transcriptional regulator, partial [Trueperaceae bacterium]|nr:BTAD domain-containing putative transcriptional regulator [Trueperaceae bacterium]
YLRSMQWASQIGETAVALDVYHQLQSVMKREFGIPPSPAAVSLAKAIAAQGIWPLAATAHENASAVPAGAQRHLGPDAGERGPRAAGRKP